MRGVLHRFSVVESQERRVNKEHSQLSVSTPFDHLSSRWREVCSRLTSVACRCASRKVRVSADQAREAVQIHTKETKKGKGKGENSKVYDTLEAILFNGSLAGFAVGFFLVFG